MAIRIPEALRDAEINVSVDLPKPKIATKADKDGSLSLAAYYDMGDIYELARRAANELNDKVDNAIIEELLEMNGYIKGCSAERTCTFSKHEKAGDPYPTCSACGYETDWHECEWCSDDTFVYEKNYCPNCGSRVIRNAD